MVPVILRDQSKVLSFKSQFEKNMKIFPAVAIISLTLFSCEVKTDHNETKRISPLLGTWKLLSGTTVEGADTVITDYTKDNSFIKIINETHFAFLRHDLTNKTDPAAFTAGGGKYDVADSLYTEHLEYCSDRAWEAHDFSFTITIKDDTLVQKGVEKVEGAGVNRLNIEKYYRLKN
jgi:hypothetical protein